MSAFKNLFSPIRIGSMELKNRIVMAPMTIDSANPDESPSDKQIAYYAERAKGGVGLIGLEVCTIDQNHRYQQRSLGLYSDMLIPGHKRLVEAIHAHGAKVQPQLVHAGPESLSPFFTGKETIGASVIRTPTTRQVCREATIDEIEVVIAQFGEAARRAREAGYDGIELHSAHSYLFLGSFLSPLRNLRQDEYAGHTFEGRTRLLFRVIERIKSKAGSDYPITVRLSGFERESGGREINDTQRLAPLLEAAGVRCLHISGGVSDANITQIITGPEYRQGYNLAATEAVRKVVNIPVMVVGQNNDLVGCEAMLASGQADLVAVGRGLLADPEMPNKAARGELQAIIPCTLCQGCVDVMMSESAGVKCFVNPRSCREAEFPAGSAALSRNVLVVGGGPAGMMAASVAAERGHQVTLVERSSRLGGSFVAAAEVFSPNKALLDHLCYRLQNSSAQVRLGEVVTAESAGKYKPDVIIVATGGRIYAPDIKGAETNTVITAEMFRHAVIEGTPLPVADSVAVIGASLVGLEIAEYLASQGKKVHILETGQRYAGPAGKKRRSDHAKRLDLLGVPLNTGIVINEITADGVSIATPQGRKSLVKAKTILVVGQHQPDASLSDALKPLAAEVYAIGDCSGFALSRKALDEAMATAFRL